MRHFIKLVGTPLVRQALLRMPRLRQSAGGWKFEQWPAEKTGKQGITSRRCRVFSKPGATSPRAARVHRLRLDKPEPARRVLRRLPDMPVVGENAVVGSCSASEVEKIPMPCNTTPDWLDHAGELTSLNREPSENPAGFGVKGARRP